MATPSGAIKLADCNVSGIRADVARRDSRPALLVAGVLPFINPLLYPLIDRPPEAVVASSNPASLLGSQRMPRREADCSRGCRQPPELCSRRGLESAGP